MQASIDPELFSTDLATKLAKQGIPFRDAYRQVAESLSEVEAGDLEKTLQARVSPGASGNLYLRQLTARLQGLGLDKN